MAPPRIQRFARNAQSGLLDTFMVSAVLTVLTIRVYLKAANYPQVGGGGLHVAHVLWGGLGMLIAIVMLLVFLGPTTQRLAAITGGIGFGAFVDELGKFLTADNNYFFKPTAALVYTLFVVVFLLTRQIRRVRTLTPQECLVNAIELSKEMAMGQLSLAERERALGLLDAADQSHPMVALLREEFVGAAGSAERVSRLASVAAAGEGRYLALVETRWFRRIVAGLFVLQAFTVVVGTIAVLVFGAALLAGVINAQTASRDLGPNATGWMVEGAASLVAGTFTVIGVLALRKSRIRAYRWFEVAVLVGLLLGRPFTLLEAGFGGLAQVFVDLALLVTLRYMIGQERQLAAGLNSEAAGGGSG